MDAKEKKSLSTYLIALSTILSNLVIFAILYEVPFLSGIPWIQRALDPLAIFAVYPIDLFQIYLKNAYAVHYYWIFGVGLSGLGLLFFNPYARIIFIVFNILNFVFLSVIAAIHVANLDFGIYFFKWYFNLVMFLIYVGMITLEEIRHEFTQSRKNTRWDMFWIKFHRKTLSEKDARGFFNLGLAYAKLGRMDEALEFVARAVQIAPAKAQFHFELAQILYSLQKNSEAILSLKQAIAIDPLSCQFRLRLAELYEETGCLQQAVECYRRAIYLEPQNVFAIFNLGQACMSLGYSQEAQGAMRKVIEIDPENFLGYYYLGLILMTDESRLKEAEELFLKALRYNPVLITGYQQLGNLYVQEGDYKNAVRMFRDVLRLGGNDKQAHYQLGFAYAMLNDIESARREHRILRNLDIDLANTLGLLINRR